MSREKCESWKGESWKGVKNRLMERGGARGGAWITILHVRC